MTFVSVVIPVFDDQQRLKLCLDALASQTYPPDKFEVIVADNDSPVPVDLTAWPFARSVNERRPGSYAARNAALGEARGDIIAFTDSDCIPSARWLERGVAAMEARPEVGIVGGRVKVFARELHDRSRVETYELLTAFPQSFYIENYHFAVTANLFARKDVIRATGGFRDGLRSGGDRDFCLRARDFGFSISYAKDAVVRHPARRSLQQIHSKVTRVVAGMFDSISGYGEYPRGYKPSVLTLAKGALRASRLAMDRRLESPSDRVAVAAIAMFVYGTGEIEKLRLLAGAAPRGR